MSIKLCDGKYTFYEDEDGNLFCARYDAEQWRGFVGDKAVSALYRHGEDLHDALEALLNKTAYHYGCNCGSEKCPGCRAHKLLKESK